MGKRNLNVFFSLFALLLLLQTLACKETVSKTQSSNSLVILTGAYNVKKTNEPGKVEVNYEVMQAFPAPEAIGRIAVAMSESGWTPFEEDFLNPGMPSSLVRGWTDYREGSLTADSGRTQWIGQWKNPKGEVAEYRLLYRGFPNNRKHLAVTAFLISPAIVNKMTMIATTKGTIMRLPVDKSGRQVPVSEKEIYLFRYAWKIGALQVVNSTSNSLSVKFWFHEAGPQSDFLTSDTQTTEVKAWIPYAEPVGAMRSATQINETPLPFNDNIVLGWITGRSIRLSRGVEWEEAHESDISKVRIPEKWRKPEN